MAEPEAIPTGVYWSPDTQNFYNAAHEGQGDEFYMKWRFRCVDFPLGLEPSPATQSEPNGWEWAIVEIFGHRRHAGRIREEERFGSKMLRIDVPLKGAPETNGWETHWYGGSSIFSLTLTDEATALRANKPYESPSRYLPTPGEPDFGPASPPDDDAGDDFED